MANNDSCACLVLLPLSVKSAANFLLFGEVPATIAPRLLPELAMNHQFKLASFVLFFFVSIAWSALSVQAQSGRRQTKPPAAAPVPTPTPEPTPNPKEEPKSDLGFLVGIDRSDSFSYNPLTFYTIVRNGCADRLRKESAANVSTADHMTRSDAIKKAKAEKTTYVVLLRLVGQFRGGSRTIDDDEIVIEFVVFEPVTAKIKVNGRSYQNAARAGPIILQPPGGGSRGILYSEQLLKRAAEDAADRILNSLHLRARK